MLTNGKKLALIVTGFIIAVAAVAGHAGAAEADHERGASYSMLFATFASSGGRIFDDGSVAIIGQPLVGTISNDDYTMIVGALPGLLSDTTSVEPPILAGGPPCTVDGDCTGDWAGARCVSGTCYIPRNRYISIDPRGAGGANVGKNLDIRLTLATTLVNGVTAVGSQWWANAPDANCIAVVGPTRPATPPNWDACPTLHLTGCPIIPTSTYDIVVVDGSTVSDPPLVAATQAMPGVKWHGDCVGFFTGTEWTAPNGQTSIDDAVAAIKTFQNPSATPGCGAPPCNATHTSVTDMVPNLTPGPQINLIVNIADVFAIIQGFQGLEYPGPQIELCPD